jgi:hypothetical protein
LPIAELVLAELRRLAAAQAARAEQAVRPEAQQAEGRSAGALAAALPPEERPGLQGLEQGRGRSESP